MRTCCPACHKALKLPEGYTPEQVKCPNCGEKFNPQENITTTNGNRTNMLMIVLAVSLCIVSVILLIALQVQNRKLIKVALENQALHDKVRRLEKDEGARDTQRNANQQRNRKTPSGPSLPRFTILERKMLNAALIFSVSVETTKTSQLRSIAEQLVGDNNHHYMIRVFFYTSNQTQDELPLSRYEWTKAGGLTKTY